MNQRNFRLARYVWLVVLGVAILFSLIGQPPLARADDDSPEGFIRQKTTLTNGEAPVFDNQGINKQEAAGNESQPQPGTPEDAPKSEASNASELTGQASIWKTLYFEDFESTGIPSGLWTVNEYSPSHDVCWDDRSAGASGALTYSGNWSIWNAGGCTNYLDPSGGVYANDMRTEAVYGPFSLANVSDAKLEFAYNNNTELGYDHFCYFASGDATNWQGECVSGDSGGWVLETLSLKKYVGDPSVYISFYFYSDVVFNNSPGTFVDNVHILVSQTATFTSNKTHDGWVLESTETSNKGGTMNATEKYLRVGDDASDRQYRSIVSFNTASLPDGATVTKGQLRLRQHSFVGNNNFATLTFDVRKGFFGVSKLELSDFQKTANAMAGHWGLGFGEGGSWIVYNFNNEGLAQINKTGTTQLRIRLMIDDNNDNAADYFRFYSANAGSTNAPKLTVTYTVP
jgi:hypothetical protein